MQVRVRGLGSHAARATPRAGAAPPRRGAGDGDGLLADGRAPLYCYIRASFSRCPAAVYFKAALCSLLIVIRIS